MSNQAPTCLSLLPFSFLLSFFLLRASPLELEPQARLRYLTLGIYRYNDGEGLTIVLYLIDRRGEERETKRSPIHGFVHTISCVPYVTFDLIR